MQISYKKNILKPEILELLYNNSKPFGLKENPYSLLEKIVNDLPPNTEIEILQNTDEVYYVVLPHSNYGDLDNETLSSMNAAKSAQFSRNSAGTLSTLPSSVGSLSCGTLSDASQEEDD